MSKQTRIGITPELLELPALKRLRSRRDDVTEFTELALVHSYGDPASQERAASVIQALTSDTAKTAAGFAELLPESSVTAVRMGAARPAGEHDQASQPFVRTHIGAGLTDTPEVLWPASRGFWRMRPAEYLVPSRLGLMLAVFKIDDWEEFDGRIFATSGSVIDVSTASLIPVVHEGKTARLDHVRATSASDKDMLIAETLTGQVCEFSQRATNPVVNLRKSGLM